MRIKKSIMKKINDWKNEPMLVTGVYRLFTYIPWEDIPKEYKKLFNKEAAKVWNDDLKGYTGKQLLNDAEIQIKGLLRSLPNRNIIHTIGMIPMLLADLYVYGKSVDSLVKRVLNLKDSYLEYVDLDRNSAEVYSILEIADILKDIRKRFELELDFDIDTIVNRILNHLNKFRKTLVPLADENAVEAEIEANLENFNPFVVQDEEEQEKPKGEDKIDR